jgi:hypothetical protein
MATHDRIHTEDAAGVLYAEQSRCQALEKDDFGALEALISPRLTHTHTRGNTDNFESYFLYIREKIKFVECKRGPLSVRLVGQIAIMTGPMQNIVSFRGASETVTTSAQVLQVWEWRAGRWMLLAFQSTALKS